MSNRSGSNNRKLDGVVAFRITSDDRKLLDRHARELGFKNANELAKFRLAADLELALSEVGGGSAALATAS